MQSHKIYIILLFFSCGHQHPPSQRLGVNQSNIGRRYFKSTSQIKIPPCTFLIDHAQRQQQKHVKVQVKDLKIATFFLQMLEKSTSTFNLTTKWKTYLTLGPNFMRLTVHVVCETKWSETKWNETKWNETK